MKRSTIKPTATALLRRTPMARTSVQTKDAECAHCGRLFRKTLPMQRVCGPVCAGRRVKAEQKARDQAAKAQTRERKAALKTLRDLIAEAQTAFNAFIRERDRGRSCICCNRPLGEGDVGGAYDCGHYRSTGSAPHLRFDERNAHAQRKHCNRWGAGRAVDYRLGLVARLGREAVEALESDNAPRKWDRTELIALKATYRQKTRELLKARGT